MVLKPTEKNQMGITDILRNQTVLIPRVGIIMEPILIFLVQDILIPHQLVKMVLIWILAIAPMEMKVTVLNQMELVLMELSQMVKIHMVKILMVIILMVIILMDQILMELERMVKIPMGLIQMDQILI